jgi:hypothetical protein
MMGSTTKLIWDAVGNLFDSLSGRAENGAEASEGTPAASLEDLSGDDLMRERLRLEQEEKKLLRQVEEVENEKRAAFEQATREGSVRKQTILARKIKELDTKAKNIDRNLRVISKQLRIINGFIQVKENKRIWEQSGLWTQISQMDLSDLGAYVDEAVIEGSFNNEKFSGIISTLEGSRGIVDDVEEDPDVMNILGEIQAAAAAREASPEAVDESFQRLEEQLQTQDEDTELF